MYRGQFGVYFYRYTIPAYIRTQCPTAPTCVRRSLRTSQRSEAVYLVSKWHALVHEAITNVLNGEVLDIPYSLDKESPTRKIAFTEITELEDIYIEEKIRSGAWTSKTFQIYKAQFTLFRRIIGKT